MEKHELLKYAYDNYPKGTVYTWAKDTLPRKVTSSGKFCFKKNELDNDLELHDEEDGGLSVFNGDEWAEIVKPKIAVKVENEKEFKVLMKYYDSLGYVWNGGDKPLSKESLVCYPNAIKFEDKFQHSVEKESIGYQIIHFSDFAKEHNIKLPLLTSEDGVDLYEGDEYFRVCDIGSKNINWVLITITESRDISGILEQGKTFQKNDKIFSTKQAALDWIEAQKPKTIYIKCCHEFIALVDKNRITWQGDKPNIITKETIVKIYNAMQELS